MLGWPVTREPVFSTRRQESISGKETVIADQSTPRYLFTLTADRLRQGTVNGAAYTELAQLQGFFEVGKGGADSFLYQDADDNAVTAQQIGVGDGVTTSFQLIRTFGGAVLPILAPNVVTSVTVAGAAKSNGTDYGIGTWENGVTPNGTVNFFTGAPGAGAAIVASFSYYFPCRFVDDTMTFDKVMDKRWEVKKIQFKSIK